MVLAIDISINRMCTLQRAIYYKYFYTLSHDSMLLRKIITSAKKYPNRNFLLGIIVLVRSQELADFTTVSTRNDLSQEITAPLASSSRSRWGRRGGSLTSPEPSKPPPRSSSGRSPTSAGRPVVGAVVGSLGIGTGINQRCEK